MKDFVTLMKYRDGDLEDGDRKALQSLIEKDQEISEMLEFLEELDEAIVEEHVDEFEKKVEDLLQSHKDKKKEELSTGYSKMKRLKKYYVAATILLFLVLGSALYLIKNADNPDKLFSKYYSSYIADVVTRSSDLSMEPELNKAFEFYNNHAYAEAITSFSKLVDKDEYNLVSHFHLGMSYLELGMYQKASSNLKNVIQREENIYTQSAKWYLSLCLIKQDKTDEAKELLIELEKVNYYSQRATELLKSLP